MYAVSKCVSLSTDLWKNFFISPMTGVLVWAEIQLIFFLEALIFRVSQRSYSTTNVGWNN